MKKLLLVLLVVALASFLFVGCVPTTPAEGEGEGEGETEVAVCPTVTVTSQVAVDGKTYVKGGSQTITVTFAVPTEPVSVYVATALKAAPSAADEVVIYANADKTVYTGTFYFGGCASDCAEGYIYVDTCLECDFCKYPYIVDEEGPATEIEISTEACTCEGCDLVFETPEQSTVCGETDVCCDDYCSGFASYTIDLYTSDPFDECCEVPCVTPEYSCPAGVACPVDCTLSCIDEGTYYVVVTLLDAVGNSTRYYAKVVLTEGDPCTIEVTEYEENDMGCTDWEVEIDTDDIIGECLGVEV